MGLIDPAALLTAWPLGAVGSIAPTEPGHNNRSWVVKAAAGKYVLRLYDNLREEAIHFEHTLLTRQGITERSTLDGTINWVLTIDKSLDQRGAELVATLRRAAAL